MAALPYFPGDTATVRLDNLRLNGTVDVLSGADISFVVTDESDAEVAAGVGEQVGSSNDWILTFDVPIDTVAPTYLKVEALALYNGATRTIVVLVPVGVV